MWPDKPSIKKNKFYFPELLTSINHLIHNLIKLIY